MSLRHPAYDARRHMRQDVASLDGYCSTVQGLLDWFEADLGVTKLLFMQTDLSCMQ